MISHLSTLTNSVVNRNLIALITAASKMTEEIRCLPLCLLFLYVLNCVCVCFCLKKWICVKWGDVGEQAQVEWVEQRGRVDWPFSPSNSSGFWHLWATFHLIPTCKWPLPQTDTHRHTHSSCKFAQESQWAWTVGDRAQFNESCRQKDWPASVLPCYSKETVERGVILLSYNSNSELQHNLRKDMDRLATSALEMTSRSLLINWLLWRSKSGRASNHNRWWLQ